MLIGNPDGFAIWLDYVEPWSTEVFKNGAFGYFLGGELIWSLRSTIGPDIGRMESFSCLRRDAVDRVLFDMPVKDAYRKLYDRTYPDMDIGVDNDWKHAVVPVSLSDEGYCVFLVESGSHAKLIYGREGDSSTALETRVALGEFQRVVLQTIEEWDRVDLALRSDGQSGLADDTTR